MLAILKQRSSKEEKEAVKQPSNQIEDVKQPKHQLEAAKQPNNQFEAVKQSNHQLEAPKQLNQKVLDITSPKKAEQSVAPPMQIKIKEELVDPSAQAGSNPKPQVEIILNPNLIKPEPMDLGDKAAIFNGAPSADRLPALQLAMPNFSHGVSDSHRLPPLSHNTGGGGVIINTGGARSDGGMHFNIRIKPEFSPAAKMVPREGEDEEGEDVCEVDLMTDSDEENRSLASSGGGEKKRRKPVPLVTTCPICGNPAPGHNHFGGLCCYSCRAFFRRTSKRPLTSFKCRGGENNCVLTAGNKCCIRCRLRKCFKVGMDPSLIKGRRVGRRSGSSSSSLSPKLSTPPMSAVSVIRSAGGDSLKLAPPSTSTMFSRGSPTTLEPRPTMVSSPARTFHHHLIQRPSSHGSQLYFPTADDKWPARSQVQNRNYHHHHQLNSAINDWPGYDKAASLKKDQFDLLSPPPLISSSLASYRLYPEEQQAAAALKTTFQRHNHHRQEDRRPYMFYPQGQDRYDDIPKLVPILSQQDRYHRSSLDSLSPPVTSFVRGQELNGSDCSRYSSNTSSPQLNTSSPQLSCAGDPMEDRNGDELPLDLTKSSPPPPPMAKLSAALPSMMTGGLMNHDYELLNSPVSHTQKIGLPRLFFKSQ